MTDRPLWTVQAMAAAMGAVPAGPLPLSVPGISIDTRTVATGEAFFAIKGDNRDGHEFVEAALAAGAGLAVVAADRRDRFPDAAPLLVVADVLDGLRDLARAARARTRAKIVAVTGSVGKTSTKEALRLALGADGETHASVASYNNHWGVPLSLARCPRDRTLRGVRDRHEPCRRDRAADAPGAAAGGDRHHGRAGASRILPFGRGDRRRQGRNLSRARAGRGGGHQSRQSAIRPPRARRAGRRRCAHSSLSANTRARMRG